MKNNFVKLAAVLFIIGAVASGILAWLNDVTSERIALNEAMASMDPAILEAVMPGSVMFNDYEDTDLVETIKGENEKVINLLTAVDASGNELGKVIRTFSTVRGFSGDMELYVGFTPEGQISGVSVISHQETEGLGSRTAEPAFTGQFTGKSGEVRITEDEIDAITGATMSVNSFVSAVNNAIDVYSEYVK
ncbi:MAG: FMN-binding protein [Tissierellia bacterium]|nr:FMN-binding protein [Tissierellia bacterium]